LKLENINLSNEKLIGNVYYLKYII
jgi:hypothetical protein